MAKYLATDSMIRFFIARDYDVEASVEMHLTWVRWMLEFKADKLDPESIRGMLLKETCVLGPIDKQKRLSILIRPRFHNPGEF